MSKFGPNTLAQAFKYFSYSKKSSKVKQRISCSYLALQVPRARQKKSRASQCQALNNI